MSFEYYNNSPIMLDNSNLNDCVPDYEKQAANIKTQLNSTIKFKMALFDYMETNDTQRFQNITSFAELVGGINIIEHEQERLHNQILNKLDE